MRVTRFRLHSALTVAGVITVISAFSLAAVGGILLIAPLVPLLFTIWAWRAGTDANPRGLRVRAGFIARDIAWNEVTALAVGPRRRVIATLADGRSVTLTAVRPADLRTLVAASGQSLTTQTATVAA